MCQNKQTNVFTLHESGENLRAYSELRPAPLYSDEVIGFNDARLNGFSVKWSDGAHVDNLQIKTCKIYLKVDQKKTKNRLKLAIRYL